VKRLGIITKPGEPRAVLVAAQIGEWASHNGLELLLDDRILQTRTTAELVPAEEIAADSDVLVVLGGDGTMIAAARLVGGRVTPVLGVNLGALGYLTEFSVEEALPALERVAAGDYESEARTMLDWAVNREGEEIGTGCVLNDVVVNKATLARIIDIDCSVGRDYVTTYRADGLIVATPTGSTAYNLSAGGPIIHPTAETIVISPICPHTLTNRPLVLPDKVEVTLGLVTRDQQVMITSDGQTGLNLMAGDLVRIGKSAKTFNMIRPKDRDYFRILRDKLRWSGR
jgi:NAD+ kinase